MTNPRLGRPVGLADGDEFLRALPSAVNGDYVHRRVVLSSRREGLRPVDELADEIVAGLGARWSSVETAPDVVPAEPGLYAIWCDWRGLAHLREAVPGGFLDPGAPLYVGKSESSLRDRDVRTHFGLGRTGHSTLRRSIAALLHRLGHVGPLQARPRNPEVPKYFSNYALDDRSEHLLQDWMEHHLAIGWWGSTADAGGRAIPTLGELEREVIAHPLWGGCPPLNLKDLDGRITATGRSIKLARKVLAGQAEAWPGTAAAGGRPVSENHAVDPSASVAGVDGRAREIAVGHPDPRGAAVEFIDDQLAAGVATGTRAERTANAPTDDGAVRIMRRGGRTIMLCIEGPGGRAAAKSVVDALDREAPRSQAPELDPASLTELLQKVDDRVRVPSARAGERGLRVGAALAIVEDGRVRWGITGEALIALVHPDGTVERIGQIDGEEPATAPRTGDARLWPGGWLVVANGVPTSIDGDWRTTLLGSATVRTHYPMDDSRRAVAIPMAAAVVGDLIGAGQAGRANSDVSVLVLGRKTFSELPPAERSEAMAAWQAAGGGIF